jgi:uncharacterized protein (DUF1810 family)
VQNEAQQARDPHDFHLDRFLAAQDSGQVYDRAVAELRRGRKTSHWMWFVFPQIAGLGESATSRFYAISELGEAKAFLSHPVLGPRLIEVTEAVLTKEGVSAESIFGALDAQKLFSSMTLFARADSSGTEVLSLPVFRQVLDAFFDGREDDATLGRL